MGGDAFFGFDGPPSISVNKILSIMKYAYAKGIRAFDFSIQNEVIEAISCMKLIDPDISFFANISWRCGVNLDGTDLIDLKARALNSVEKHLTPIEKEQLKHLLPHVRSHWFSLNPSTPPFSENEIERISIDLTSFRSKLKIAKQYAQYCMIGANFGDWFALFERTDLLVKMCEEIIANGMIPFAIIQWPSLTLPRILSLPFYGYCCMLDPSSYLLSYSNIYHYISQSEKPIYGFGLLRGQTQHPKLIREAIRKAFSIPNLYGSIIGLKSYKEIDITVPIIFGQLSALKNGHYE